MLPPIACITTACSEASAAHCCVRASRASSKRTDLAAEERDDAREDSSAAAISAEERGACRLIGTGRLGRKHRCICCLPHRCHTRHQLAVRLAHGAARSGRRQEWSRFGAWTALR
eukprot:scaffold8005_cov118-Isochrysis_galbana.AAC.2